MFCPMSQPLEMSQVGCLARERVYRFHKASRLLIP